MPLVVPDTDQTPDLLELEAAVLLSKAEAWARENGAEGPLLVADPVREEFEGGHMFAVGVHEAGPRAATGKRRAWTARFDRAGRPVMWSVEEDGA